MKAEDSEEKLVVKKEELSMESGQSLAGLSDVEVRITVEWGRADITVEEASALSEESLLHTDRSASDPVDVLVNGKLFARGKLVLVGESYGVQLLEII
ncbi:MAG: FliM/FliN family flagellar motor switch protein [Candidatus Latescibacterota bacterium]